MECKRCLEVVKVRHINVVNEISENFLGVLIRHFGWFSEMYKLILVYNFLLAYKVNKIWVCLDQTQILTSNLVKHSGLRIQGSLSLDRIGA